MVRNNFLWSLSRGGKKRSLEHQQPTFWISSPDSGLASFAAVASSFVYSQTRRYHGCFRFAARCLCTMVPLRNSGCPQSESKIHALSTPKSSLNAALRSMPTFWDSFASNFSCGSGRYVMVWCGMVRYCIVSMVFFGRNIYLRQNSRKQRFLFSVFCRNFSLLNKTLLPFPTQSRSQIWQVAWSEARQDQSEVWPKKIIWCNFWGRTEQRRLW